MLGNIGQPVSVPKPSADVVAAAQAFLTAIGQEKSKIATDLKEMLRVQKHNETVLAQVQKQIAQAKQDSEDAADSMAKADKEIKTKYATLERAQTKLTNDRKSFDNMVSDHASQNGAKMDALNDREGWIVGRETVLEDLGNELATTQSRMAQKEVALDGKLKRATAKETKWDEKVAEFNRIAGK